MTAIPNVAADARAGVAAADSAAAAPSAGPFVLNLCSSTTPMALAQSDLPELKRFTFFVSRRFEEGRERFRLHMGYFATLAEAEEWLALVREIYPGAWAGEAPGRKLRERAAAAAAAQATHTAGPHPRLSAPAAPEPAPPPLNVPVVHAARLAPPSPPAAAAAPRPRPAPPVPAAPQSPAPRNMAASAVAAARAQPQRPIAATAPAAQPARQAAPALKPAAPTPKPPPLTPRTAAPAAAVARPAPAAAPAAARPNSAAPAAPPPPRPAAHAMAAAVAAARGAQPLARRQAFDDSNVREVLAALTDSVTGETRQMQAPPPPRPAPAAPSLSDTQVLKMLEARAKAQPAPTGPAIPAPQPAQQQPLPDMSEGGIPVLKPDDTATRRALQEAVTHNAPVFFAVQLQWSVQPVELDKVPPLAIFSAYTLYTVEGSRDGRKWHGLRLGFFSDVISAKQVAGYVRSEFTAVAVVPVSPQERGRATEQQDQAGVLVTRGPARTGASADEFKLIDDAPRLPPPGPPPALKPAAAAPAAPKAQPQAAPARTERQAAPARGKGRAAAGARRGPQTLEETLEILGASALTIDSGRGETLNDTGVRHLRIEEQKNSPFGRLLERLSERVKKQ
jgi:hypothetical protein